MIGLAGGAIVLLIWIITAILNTRLPTSNAPLPPYQLLPFWETFQVTPGQWPDMLTLMLVLTLPLIILPFVAWRWKQVGALIALIYATWFFLATSWGISLRGDPVTWVTSVGQLNVERYVDVALGVTLLGNLALGTSAILTLIRQRKEAWAALTMGSCVILWAFIAGLFYVNTEPLGVVGGPSMPEGTWWGCALIWFYAVCLAVLLFSGYFFKKVAGWILILLGLACILISILILLHYYNLSQSEPIDGIYQPFETYRALGFYNMIYVGVPGITTIGIGTLFIRSAVTRADAKENNY